VWNNFRGYIDCLVTSTRKLPMVRNPSHSYILVAFKVTGKKIVDFQQICIIVLLLVFADKELFV
jgi:hypothetical protein